MKKIILIGCLLAAGASGFSQGKSPLKDDSRFLNLALLISLADNGLDKIQESLANTDYEFSDASGSSDFVKYNYSVNNTFVLQRYISKKKVIYKVDYFTEGIAKKISASIKDDKMILLRTEPIDKGIRTVYNDATKKWEVTLEKTIVDGRTMLTITILPV